MEIEMINPEQEMSDLKERVLKLETTVNKSNFSEGLDAFRARLAEGFITCESGGEGGYFVKVKFERLKDTQKFHDELLKIAGGI